MRFLLARIMTPPPVTPRSKNPPVDLARCKGEKSFPSVLRNRENWKGLWESLVTVLYSKIYIF